MVLRAGRPLRDMKSSSSHPTGICGVGCLIAEQCADRLGDLKIDSDAAAWQRQDDWPLSLNCANLELNWRPAAARYQRISSSHLREMLLEPAARMLDNHLERSRLFEEVRGARHNDELFFATQLGVRGAIERYHLEIAATDNQQGRSANSMKSRLGEIRTTAA